jgi:hypothetical protein
MLAISEIGAVSRTALQQPTPAVDMWLRPVPVAPAVVPPSGEVAVPAGVELPIAGPAARAEEGAPVGLPTQTDRDKWLPEDRAKVDQYVNDAINQHGGDLDAAWQSLVAKRQLPENFYDPNLASAADYLRARLETHKYGPTVEKARIEAYLELKRHGLIPPVGPGPVSPYSEMQREYMQKGIQDGVHDLDQAGVEPPGLVEGALRAAHDDGIKGTEGVIEGGTEAVEHGVEGVHAVGTSLLNTGKDVAGAVAEAPAKVYHRLFG